jgi:hypothetical protein
MKQRTTALSATFVLGCLLLAITGCQNNAQIRQAEPARYAEPPTVRSGNPYDQPGELPANSGGTDAGRLGSDAGVDD